MPDSGNEQDRQQGELGRHKTASQIRIQEAGLHGTLRLRLVDDELAHVLEHADTDEPTGTWTGLAGPDHGLVIGSDVNVAILTAIRDGGELADFVWEAPAALAEEHKQALYRAVQAYGASEVALAEQHWAELEAIWAQAWAANRAVLEFMQETGLGRISLVKPQRWVVASFEHHCGPPASNYRTFTISS